MARVTDIYQSPWLKAEDLGGSARRVRIERAAVESIRQQDGSDQDRIVVSFHGKNKKLICNKTQAAALATLLDDDTDLWAGREIYLTPQPAVNGKTTIAIMAVPDETREEAMPF